MEFADLDDLTNALLERLGRATAAQLLLGSNWFGFYGKGFAENGAGNLVIHAQRGLDAGENWKIVDCILT